MNEKTAVIYVRVSTDKQAEKELPVESQLDQCRRKVADLGADVAQVYVDEGISGRSDNRPEFQKALAYCEAFAPDYFVCWSTSRFARNRLDAQLNKRRLLRCGTQLEYVTVRIEKSGSGVLQEGILELFDEYLSHQIGADTKRSMLRNAQAGYWNGGTPPYGYQVVPATEHNKRRKLAPVETESAVVQDIFRWRLNGLGGKAIAIRLNQGGASYRGRPWRQALVLSILKNDKMIGRITFNKVDRRTRAENPPDQWITVDSHDAIVSREDWDQVQVLISGAAPGGGQGSHKSTRMLTGLLRCGCCGSTMCVSSATGRSKTYYYYQCRKSFDGEGCDSRHKRIPVDVLDDYILDVVSTRIFTRDSLKQLAIEINEIAGKWVTKKRKKRRTLAASISQLQSRNQRLYEHLEDPGGPVNLSDLAPRLRSNNSEIKRLEKELEAVDSAEPPQFEVTDETISDLSNFLQGFLKQRDNPKKIRQFLSGFVHDIVVMDDEIRINYLPSAMLDAEAVHSTKKWLPEQGSNLRPND